MPRAIEKIKKVEAPPQNNENVLYDALLTVLIKLNQLSAMYGEAMRRDFLAASRSSRDERVMYLVNISRSIRRDDLFTSFGAPAEEDIPF
jgi:hypothetical protein